MGFELAPDPGDRGEPSVRSGRTGGAVGEERRLLTSGVEILARGSMVCPDCALPIFPVPRLAPRAELECAFCARRGAAIEFLSSGAADAPGNAVSLIARL